MELKKKLYHLRMLCAAVLLLPALTSCETIMDDLSPCRTEFRVTFRYDRNMKYADAFSREVESVDLWIFDLEGRPVWHGSEAGEALTREGYAMTVPVGPGTYDLVAWCGLAGKGADEYALAATQIAGKENLALSIRRKTEADGAFVDNDLPRLYHGMARVTFAEPAGGGTVDALLPLTKNTNAIQVLLQYYYGPSTAGKVLRKEDFDFFIESAEGDMNHDNTIRGNAPFTYRGWMKAEVSASFDEETPALRDVQTKVNGLRAERTVGRLMADRQPVLVIRRNSDGEQIVRLPLVKYLLMIKGEYEKQMTEQEFLDREDSYRLTFFLDGDDAWYRSAGIHINKWVVVPPQEEQM